MVWVPDFRRDDVWTPAFAGVTKFARFARTSGDGSFCFGANDRAFGLRVSLSGNLVRRVRGSKAPGILCTFKI
jgi:hypothetical protein